jgi:uncharacterized protein YgbK (DUF1537 family)
MEMSEKIIGRDLFASLPPEWPTDLLLDIRALLDKSEKKVVVLDDDPTGTQTVHDVPVLTEWSLSNLRRVLSETDPVVYLLTNSRSLPLDRAQALNREIAANLTRAKECTGRDFVVISRSDSTLRGHFPGEVHALIESLGGKIDGVIIVPFFLEGGRYTIHDVHYVREQEWLIPAGETEYARDPSFGYHSSNLRRWVSEKCQGVVLPEEVVSITLNDLRKGGPDKVTKKLDRLCHLQKCIVNAASYRDIEVFVKGLLQSEDHGSKFVYRSAASFVRVRGGIQPRSLLQASDLARYIHDRKGLIVVGSYTQKTNDQIKIMRTIERVEPVEVGVKKLLSSTSRGIEIEKVISRVNQIMNAGKIPLIYTSRRLVRSYKHEEALEVGQKISSALVAIVREIAARPSWLIAKGGITASDIATKSLGIRRAQVLGQAIPGVPIWLTGLESRWPELIYVVFPGNVGTPDSLLKTMDILQG